MALLILFAILFFSIAWRRLDTAIALFLFLLPSYQLRFSLFGLPITLLEVMILICFFTWFFKETEFKNFLRGKYKLSDYLSNRKKRIAYPFGKEIIFFLVASFIALGIARFSNQALGVWKAYFFEPILIYILLLNIIGQNEGGNKKTLIEKLEVYLWPIFLSALAVSLVAIFQKLTGLLVVSNFWPRVTGVFAYPNALGLYLGPLVLLMAGYLVALVLDLKVAGVVKISKKLIIKIVVVAISIIFSLIAIFLARSEGAMVGLLAVFVLALVYFIFQRFKILRYTAPVLAGLIFLFVFFSPLFFLKIVPEYSYPDFGSARLNEVYDKLTLKDFSGEVRKQQWRETFLMMKDEGRWFFGTGLSGFQTSVKDYHQEGIYFNAERDPDFRRKIVLFDQKYRSAHWRPVEIYLYPHNLIFNFWTELGLLGVLAFILLIGNFFRAGFKVLANDVFNKERLIVFSLLGAMMVLVVHGMVDVPFFKNDLSVMFFFFFGVMGTLKL